MKISLLSPEDRPGLLQRLQLLGFGIQKENPERVRSLDAHSTDLIYLIAYDLTSSEQWPDLRVQLARASRYYVVFGRDLNSRQIMHAARDGAHDVVLESDGDERWEEVVQGAGQSQQLWWQLYGGAYDMPDAELLVGRSTSMQALRDACRRLGPTLATVLITGESGTGKERVAEYLHQTSGRKPFVPVNVSAIPKDLLESELFGVEKGAFTGAVRSKPGLAEEASGGTLFLDEIGELDLQLQPKLLRFLETRQARRVGSTREYECEVRLIAATNLDLESAMEQNRFRSDLYYRLSEITLKIPPLRHRKDDIPDLTRLFMKDSAVRLGKNFESLEPELVKKLQEFQWPGNVRELKQAIDRMAILYDGPVLRADWWLPPANRPFIPMEATQSPYGQPIHSKGDFQFAPTLPSGPGRLGFPSRREKMELAQRLLQESDNDLMWVASQLGIHPTTLYRWRKSGKV